MSISPERKALIVSVCFTVIGVVAWHYQVTDWQAALPLAIFYVTLLCNTFFSVKLFSSITPSSHLQNTMDALLVFTYLGVAWNLGNPLLFVFFALLLFIVAPAKYAFLLNITEHPHLMKRKIIVDLSGTLACALTLGALVLGYSEVSAWGLAIIFVIANIYLFFVRPLYRLDSA